METQAENADFSYIRNMALGLVQPSQLEIDVSKRHVQYGPALQALSTVARSQSGYLTRGPFELHSLSQPELGSTVPDSQGKSIVRNDGTTQMRLSLSQPDLTPISDSSPKKMSSGSAPGDTQPVSQSVYDSIVNKSRITEPLAEPSTEPSEVQAHRKNGDTQYTLEVGDDGHIDLLGDYEAAHSGQDEANNSDGEDFSPTQGEPRVEFFPESQRFKTPATAGKKRNYLGETVESPSLPRHKLGLNGNAGGTIGLSQIFNATQAPSSPFANDLSHLGNAPPSGPISDRPSPIIELETRPVSAGLSSPIREGFRRSKSDPHTKYVSMKQSQAERERNVGSAELADSLVGDGFTDFDHDSYVERQERQKRRDEETRRQYAALNNTSKPVERNFYTPGRPQEPLLVYDDNDELSDVDAVEGNITEEETEQEDEAEIAPKESPQLNVEHSEEDKENFDASAVEVPNTASRLSLTNVEDHEPATSPIISRHGEVSFAVANSQTSQPPKATLNVNSAPLINHHHLSDEDAAVIPQSQVGTSVMHQDYSTYEVKSVANLQQSTIPETSPTLDPVPGQVTGSSSMPAPFTHSGPATTRSSEANNFETARSHLTTGSTGPIAFPGHGPSGRRLKTATEIGLEPSPQSSALEVDPDIGLGILRDKDFESAIGLSSPIPPGRKRRRVNDGLSIPVSESSDPSQSKPSNPISPSSSIPEARVEETDRSVALSSSISLRSTRVTKPRSKDGVWDLEPTPPEQRIKAKSLGLTRNQPTSTTRQANLSIDMQKQDNTEQVSIVPGKPDVEAPHNKPAFKSPVRRWHTSGSSSGNIVAPNQVLALFKGSPPGYYPATCIGFKNDTQRFVVRWEGDAFRDTEVDAYGIKKLEFKAGDFVKVNLDNFNSTAYVILGFKDMLDPPTPFTGAESRLTDVYGHLTLVLAPKKPQSTVPDDAEVRTAPIGSVYLNSNMWRQMKDREFTYTSSAHHEGFHTPSERPSTPSAAPPSRSRRLMREVLHPTGSKLALAPSTTGVFAGMVFAISCEDEVEKASLISQIEQNGGRVLEEGFDVLFQYSVTPNATPRKRPSLSPEQEANESVLALTQQASHLGFAAVLAENHSRKPKYMQALALGIPCLHVRWAEDCLSREALQPWTPYLLPAGDSQYLWSATRSRILPASEPETAKLVDTIASRPILLQGQSVLVALGRGKNEVRQKACSFLLSAMGAGRVGRASDLKAAKALMAQEWDWIVTDASQKEIETLIPVEVSDRPKVVTSKYVLQSLILGQLLGD